MQYRTEFSDSLPGYVTIMTFQLRTETISSQHLQGMKNALFNKLAKSLPAAFFTPQKSISVSKLIEKIIPYLQGFQGPPPQIGGASCRNHRNNLACGCIRF